MKKTFRYVLMAALTVGLSFAVTSCKDDDNDSGGENMEQLESTGGEVSMEDIQLSTLISNFAEVQADELLAQSGWQQKTYEATLGTVLDESRPTVRSIELGTIEAADERAEAMLRELGIDGQSPSGFQFSNASVGTVSYQHGGGSDANTLAVINLDVRQLPPCPPTTAPSATTAAATSSGRTDACGYAPRLPRRRATTPTSSASGPTTARTTAVGARTRTWSIWPRTRWPADTTSSAGSTTS